MVYMCNSIQGGDGFGILGLPNKHRWVYQRHTLKIIPWAALLTNLDLY